MLTGLDFSKLGGMGGGADDMEGLDEGAGGEDDVGVTSRFHQAES